MLITEPKLTLIETQKLAMHPIALELDNEIFFCPAKGRLIHGPDNFKPSPATVFYYTGETIGLDFGEETYEKLWDRVNSGETDEEDDERPFDRFLAALSDPNLLVFSLTTRGLACGPVWFTVHVGIDMGRARIEGADEANPAGDDG